MDIIRPTVIVEVVYDGFALALPAANRPPRIVGTKNNARLRTDRWLKPS
jgi:hypothetical protein